MTMNQVRPVMRAAGSLAEDNVCIGALHPATSIDASSRPAASTRPAASIRLAARHALLLAWLPRRVRFIGRPHRLDVGDDLPDLIARDFRPPRGHAFPPSFRDRREDRRVVAAVEPVVVAKARTHAPSGVIAVTAGTVVPLIQSTAVDPRGLVAGVWIRHGRERAVRTGLWPDVIRVLRNGSSGLVLHEGGARGQQRRGDAQRD